MALVNYRSTIILFIISSTMFWLNINHGAEQTIWARRFLSAAINLSENGIYSLDGINVASYPIWGYSILASLANRIFGFYEAVLILQYMFFIVSFVIVYKRFYKVERTVTTVEKVLFSGCVIFFATVLSTKWPDAILSFLLFLTITFSLDKKYTTGIICLALAYNFRSEALIFMLVYFMYLFIVLRVPPKVGMFAVTLILLAPWSIYQYSQNNEIMIGASNSPGVVYITMGQLPENKWNRVHSDSSAGNFVKGKGVDDPWGIEGGKLLKKEVFENIRQYPVEYVKKVGYNMAKAIVGGLYVTEIANITDDKILRYTSKTKLIKERYLAGDYEKTFEEFVRVCLLGLYLLLYFCSIIFFIYLLFYLFRNLKIDKVNGLVLLFILTQLMVSGLFQNQPRHTSHVVGLFVILLCLIFIKKYEMQSRTK